MASYTTDLNKVMLILSELREIGDMMQAQQAQCLMTVAMRPGITMTDMSKMTGLALSSCSRNIMALSQWHRIGKPGYGLVEAVDDPREPRRKIVFLTEKGRAKMQKIISILRPDEAVAFDAPTARDSVEKLYRRA